MAGRAIPGRASAPGGAPEVAVRLGGALLALAVAAVHVADQGGITALASPHWIGWGYRLIEAGGVLTALTLLCLRPAWPVPTGLGWAAGVLLGAGPFAAYIASRTVACPVIPVTSATGATGWARCRCSSRPHWSCWAPACCWHCASACRRRHPGRDRAARHGRGNAAHATGCPVHPAGTGPDQSCPTL